MDDNLADAIYDVLEEFIYVGWCPRKHFVWALCKTQLLSIQFQDGTYKPHPTDPNGVGYLTLGISRRALDANDGLRKLARSRNLSFDDSIEHQKAIAFYDKLLEMLRKGEED